MTPEQRIRDSAAPAVFPEPQPVMTREAAQQRVEAALARWYQTTPQAAQRLQEILNAEFPDQARPDDFWHSQAAGAFRDFFLWGHDHHFGHGVRRAGAMGPRHVEICSDALHLGLLPADLTGQHVLDVGCWTGGDVLVLAGLGARVTALEEHPIAARAAQRLLDLLDAPATVETRSAYHDQQAWVRQFDHVYCSGVIYHVTDPLLLMRTLFAYLKEGGTCFIETKSASGEGSLCSYSGTLEKGWNWYAPNETALGRWFVDAGFDAHSVRVHRRPNGRLLAAGRKSGIRALRETAGFSRPGSWLEGAV